MTQSAATTDKVTAIVLAGSRSAGDPLAEALGADYKALIPIAGTPMIERVVKTLMAAPSVGRIRIVFDDEPALRTACPSLFAGDYAPGIEVIPCAATVCGSVRSAVSGDAGPYLITTADHPLLTIESIETFLKASHEDADFTVGLVEERVFRADFPDNRRTFIPFKGSKVTGCNLFALMRPEAGRVLDFWERIEHERKKPWRLFLAFGLGGLLAMLFRRLSVEAAFARASRVIGCRVAPICLAMPEIAIDVDKPEDHKLATKILEARLKNGA